MYWKLLGHLRKGKDLEHPAEIVLLFRAHRQSVAKSRKILRGRGAGEGRVRTTMVIYQPARLLSRFTQNCRKQMKDDATPTCAHAGIVVIPDVAYIAFEKNGACSVDRSSQRLDHGESDDTGFGSLISACVI